MRAFLEKNEKEWFDDYVYISRQPLLDMGVEVIGFNGNDYVTLLQHNPDLRNNDIMIGSVDALHILFEESEIQIPQYLGYPDPLKPYLSRDMILCALGTVPLEFPYFVKPSKQVKLFTGTIVANEKQRELLKFFGKGLVTDDTEVFACQAINILSEYRCFVHKGELKGIQYYRGDFKLFPDPSRIELMIEKYKDAPVAYTLDVGVADMSGDMMECVETILIEVNDMWAIGSYGFDGKTYVRMCIDRLMEIKQKTI